MGMWILFVFENIEYDNIMDQKMVQLKSHL